MLFCNQQKRWDQNFGGCKVWATEKANLSAPQKKIPRAAVRAGYLRGRFEWKLNILWTGKFFSVITLFWMCSHFFCIFCAVSDIPSTQSTPNKQKRKGSALGLDPEDLHIRSPRKRSCKRSSPLPLPAKQLKSCVKELFSFFLVFVLDVYFFLSLVFLVVCA